MATIKMFGLDGSEKGAVDVADETLVLDRGAQAVHDAVVARQAFYRAGTASPLSKGEVNGSNRKPWKQKGTGRARAGLKQSPVWRGGGVAFGPHPRDYGFKLNKKVKRLARFSAFTYKQQEGCITVVEDFTFNAPKTKEYKAMLKNLNLEGKKTLLLLPENDRNVYLSGRNLQRTDIMRAIEANTYHVLNANNLIICESSLKELEKMLGE